MIFFNYGGANLVCPEISAIFPSWKCDYNFHFSFLKSKKGKKRFFHEYNFVLLHQININF